MMKHPMIWAALAASLLSTAAHGADLTRVTRVERTRATIQMADPVRAVARLAERGLGYSVLHTAGVSQRSYRVHVTCTIDESFVQTYCPTPQYVASCPSATIVCQ